MLSVFLSFFKDKDRTKKALIFSYKSLKNLIPGVLGMIGLVGLVLALVSPETLRMIFTYKGIQGLALVSLIGAIVTIPAPIAFPLAGSMLKIGASYGTIASFVTTLTMVGLMTAPLEATYFGKKFTFMRQALSFLAAVCIGLIMGFIL